MRKRRRKLFLAFCVCILLINCIGCEADNLEKSNDNEKIDLIDELRRTDTVKIEEEFFSFHKIYKIYIEGKKVGTIEGEYIHLTGDTFKLLDNYDNEYAREKQIKRWEFPLNRLAEVSINEKIAGYIGEEVIKDFFSWDKYKFHFYDSNKNEIAYTKENKLSLLDEYYIYQNGEKIYKLNEKFNICDTYEITKLKESDLESYQVIFFACIMDAIKDAETKESDEE